MKIAWIVLLAGLAGRLDAAGAEPAEPLAAPAAEASDSLMNWFRHWAQALERSAVENRYRRGRRATVVAAVRSAPQGIKDPRKPYWKGGWSEKTAAPRLKEREELAACVALILAGKNKEGLAALDAFQAAHPKSAFLGDVNEARAKLLPEKKAEPPASPPAEEKPAGKEKPVVEDKPPEPEAPAAGAAPAADSAPASPAREAGVGGE